MTNSNHPPIPVTIEDAMVKLIDALQTDLGYTLEQACAKAGEISTFLDRHTNAHPTPDSLLKEAIIDFIAHLRAKDVVWLDEEAESLLSIVRVKPTPDRDGLIESLEAGKSATKNSTATIRNGAIDYCIAIVRQHQAAAPDIRQSARQAAIDAYLSLLATPPNGNVEADIDVVLGAYEAAKAGESPVRTHLMSDGRPIFGEDSPHDIGEHLAKVCAGEIQVVDADYACAVERLSVSRKLLKEWFPDQETHRKVLGMISLLQLNAEKAVSQARTIEPVSVIRCAMALQGNQRIKLGSDLQQIAKAVLDAAKVPFAIP